MEIEGQERGRRRKAMLRMWRRAKGRLLEKEDTTHGRRLQSSTMYSILLF